MRLPPGFIFRPTDQELVGFYLRRWIGGLPIPGDAFQECDVYAAEPDHLLGGRQRAYFLATLKPSKSLRVPRRAGLGTWMLNSCKEGEPIKVAAPEGGGTIVVGYKRNLSFHLGNIKKATGFVMDQYSLCNLANDNKGQWVVCVIRQTKNVINMGAKRKREMLEAAAGAKRKREMLEAAASLPPSAGAPAVARLDDNLLRFSDSPIEPSEELMLQDKEQLKVAPSLASSAGVPVVATLENDLERYCDYLMEPSEELILQDKEQLEAAYLPPSSGVPAVASLEEDLQRFCDSLLETSEELMLRDKEQLEVAPSLPPSPGVPAVASLEDDLQRFCDSPLESSEDLMLHDRERFTEMMNDLQAIVEGRHRF